MRYQGKIFSFLYVICLVSILLISTGCSNKQQILPTPLGELRALDNFFKLLGDKKEDDKDE